MPVMKTVSRPLFCWSCDTKLYQGRPEKSCPVVPVGKPAIAPVAKMRDSTEISAKFGLMPVIGSCVATPQSVFALQPLSTITPSALLRPRPFGGAVPMKSTNSRRSPAARVKRFEKHVPTPHVVAAGEVPVAKIAETVTGKLLTFATQTSVEKLPTLPAAGMYTWSAARKL